MGGKGREGEGEERGRGMQETKGIEERKRDRKVDSFKRKRRGGEGWHRRKKCRELQETRVGEGGVRGREPDVKAEVGGPLSGTAGLLKDVLSVFLVCES